MAKDAKVKLKIDGDATGFKKATSEAEATARSSASRIASAYSAVSDSVKGATVAMQGLKSAMGWLSMGVALVSRLWNVVDKLRDAYASAGRASDELAASARKLSDEAAGNGLDLSLYTALKDQAEKAGVAADEFSQKLKDFKEHKITFDELAASIGSTASAMARAASAADASNVGTRHLAERAAADAVAAESKSAAETEAAGLHEIVGEILRRGDRFGRGGADVDALWDKLLEAAGGDVSRAGAIFNENRGFWNGIVRPHSVGVAMYGDEALRGAASRYAGNRAAEAAARQAEIDRANAEVEAARQADLIARLQANVNEYDPYEARRLAEEEAARAAAEAEKRAAADAARREKHVDAITGRASAAMQMYREIDAVRVSAPAAASSPGQYGALFGLDPSQANRERMDRERNERIKAIQEKFEKVLLNWDKIIEQTRD